MALLLALLLAVALLLAMALLLALLLAMALLLALLHACVSALNRPRCRFLTADMLGLDNYFSKLNFLYFTCFQFFGSYLVIMLVSWYTPHRAPTLKQLDRITYWTQKPEKLPGHPQMQLDEVGVELEHSQLDEDEEVQLNALTGTGELSGLQHDDTADANELQAPSQVANGEYAEEDTSFKAFMYNFVNLTGNYNWRLYATVSLYSLMGIMTIIYAVFSGIFGIAGSSRD